MSYRPSDWTPVGYRRDPVPGDPEQVLSAAQTYRALAESVDRAAQGLRSISVEGQGQTVEAIKKRAGEVSEKIQAIEGLCERAGGALTAYGSELREAQASSLQALEQARAAVAEENRHRARQQQAAEHYNASCDEVERAGYRSAFYSAQSAIDSCQASASNAAATVRAAVERRDAAAERAIAELEAALADSPAHDTLWDKLVDFGKKALRLIDDVLQEIKPYLEVISTVLDVLALASMFIPGLQPLAGMLWVASTALSAFSTATSIIHAGRKLADGDIGWGEFATSALFDLAMFGGGVVAGAKGVTKAIDAAAEGTAKLNKFNKVVHKYATKARESKVLSGFAKVSDKMAQSVTSTVGKAPVIGSLAKVWDRAASTGFGRGVGAGWSVFGGKSMVTDIKNVGLGIENGPLDLGKSVLPLAIVRNSAAAVDQFERHVRYLAPAANGHGDPTSGSGVPATVKRN